MDLNYIKNVATGAAYESAAILNRFFGKLPEISEKGPDDLVTEADVASEKQIIAAIRSKFPDHDILAEESGIHETGTSPYRWIIDPLDGTTNYAYQIPIFCISIGFAVDDDMMMGLVLNPVSGELFTAIRGEGAFLNGASISVSERKTLGEALLVTGFPYNLDQIMAGAMHRFAACLTAARGIRRLGSAALDLCFVACGRFDGFWEEHLKPWDTAAGMLIAAEAGGRVTDFSGRAFTVDKPEILATNGHIHNELQSILEIKI
jgi:myo-inositol-1(or 4)-monophosphatase